VLYVGSVDENYFEILLALVFSKKQILNMDGKTHMFIFLFYF
jgi:hypothetical protein